MGSFHGGRSQDSVCQSALACPGRPPHCTLSQSSRQEDMQALGECMHRRSSFHCMSRKAFIVQFRSRKLHAGNQLLNGVEAMQCHQLPLRALHYMGSPENGIRIQICNSSASREIPHLHYDPHTVWGRAEMSWLRGRSANQPPDFAWPMPSREGPAQLIRHGPGGPGDSFQV